MNDEFEAGKDYKPNKADWLDGRWSHLNKRDEEYQRGQRPFQKTRFTRSESRCVGLAGYPLRQNDPASFGSKEKDV